MRESNEISYDRTKATRLYREHTCWPELGGALEASSASQSAPGVPDFRDCRRNSGCRHFPDFYRASARDLAAAGDGDTCWRWSIQACPHGRGGRPILPTPVVAAIKGLPDTFWPFPLENRKWPESSLLRLLSQTAPDHDPESILRVPHAFYMQSNQSDSPQYTSMSTDPWCMPAVKIPP